MGDWIVAPLDKGHERDDFSCGHASLDDFLKKYASQYARRKLGSTYVAMVSGQPRVLGYYTLAPSHFEFAHAPAALLKGLPKHPVPSLLLARLAVCQSERGQGLGKYLLLDAFDRCLRGRLSSDRGGSDRRPGRRLLRKIRFSTVSERSPSFRHCARNRGAGPRRMRRPIVTSRGKSLSVERTLDGAVPVQFLPFPNSAFKSSFAGNVRFGTLLACRRPKNPSSNALRSNGDSVRRFLAYCKLEVTS